MRAAILILAASAAAVAIGVALIAVLNDAGGPALPDATASLPDNFGIIVNPPTQETSLADLDALYEKSAQLGSTRSNVYIFWDTLEPAPGEYDWDITDAIMSLHKRHGMDATVFFSIVNGKTFGPLPDWMGRPTLDAVPAGDVAAAVTAIASRYPGVVDSVIIAGDTDAHFESDTEMLDAYNLLFDDVRAELALENPDVKIGNAFSLDRILNRGTEDVIASVSQGDFVAFTYRPANVLNEISKSPAEARQDLQEMSRIAGGTPIALFEVGWSTSDEVFGSQVDQAAFVDELVEFAETAEIEFVTWYRLHDRPGGTCHVERTADTGILITDSGELAAANLERYICSAGILDQHGEQKAGWRALASQ